MFAPNALTIPPNDALPIDLPQVPTTNPFVFLVGAPRSGTTLLKRLVAAHSQIAITRETHWIPRFAERRKGIEPTGHVKASIIPRLLKEERFLQLKFSESELAELLARRRPLHYAELIDEIFTHYARRKGKQLAGDKTPTYARKLHVLCRLWPNARVIHLVRDGRDVWLSMRTWRRAATAAASFATWKQCPVMTTALWWKLLATLAREDGLQFAGDRYLQLAYERLVVDTALACHHIANHLQIDYEPAMLRYHEHSRHAATSGSANATYLPPTPGLRDWRSQMPSTDVARFEAAAGDALLALGYELSGQPQNDELRRLARDIEQQFVNEAAARGWRLPRGWRER